MNDVADAAALLERGPRVLRALYTELPDPWLHAADPGEWSAHSVLVHMVTVEDHAWIHRIEHALDHPGSELPPVNPGGPDPDRTVATMLDDFARLRTANLERLHDVEMPNVPAMHGVLGEVDVHQILATWAIHDLNHIAQALASISTRYRSAVGPFIPNLGILSPSRATP